MLQSIQRISVMMQNKGGQKNCERLPIRNPKAYSALEWLALALLQGPPGETSLEKALRLYKRPKHMNGCDVCEFSIILRDTSRYTINISSAALISDCGVEQDHGEHLDFDERFTTTQQRYTPGLALLWCFAC